MLALTFRRPPPRLPCSRFLRPSHHSSRPPRLPLPPTVPPQSTAGLVALLATMGGLQLYSSPVTGSFESAAFVARHFTLNSRPYTLLTSTLYTPAAGYALLNLIWLGIAGRHVCRAVGSTRFIALFVGNGALANMASVAFKKNRKQEDGVFRRPQLVGGSSCAVDFVVTLNALLYPPSRVALTRRWMRWPLWIFSARFLMRDEGERPPWAVDSAPRVGHVAGVLCGLATFVALRTPPRYI